MNKLVLNDRHATNMRHMCEIIESFHTSWYTQYQKQQKQNGVTNCGELRTEHGLGEDEQTVVMFAWREGCPVNTGSRFCVFYCLLIAYTFKNGKSYYTYLSYPF